MLNTPPHLEARDPRGFVSIFHGTSSSVARRRLRASDLSFWQSMPSFDIGRPGLQMQSGASVVFGWCGRDAREPLHRFQSTRPVWGATYKPSAVGVDVPYFNPRAPCGARLVVAVAELSLNAHFNPRAPCGARRFVRLPWTERVQAFQSTRPVWGATEGHKGGRDHTGNFNPRAPCGARRDGSYNYFTRE